MAPRRQLQRKRTKTASSRKRLVEEKKEDEDWDSSSDTAPSSSSRKVLAPVENLHDTTNEEEIGAKNGSKIKTKSRKSPSEAETASKPSSEPIGEKPSNPRRKAPPKNRRRTSRQRVVAKAEAMSDDGADDESFASVASEEEMTESSEDFTTPTKKKTSKGKRTQRQPTRKSSRNSKSRSKKTIVDYFVAGSEEEEDERQSSEEEVAKTPMSPKRSRRTTRSKVSDDSSEEEFQTPTKSRRPPRRAASKSKRRAEADSSSESEKSDVGTPMSVNSRRSTPSRASANRATQKFSKMEEESDEEDVELTRRRKKVEKEDEDFSADNDDDEDEDDEEEEDGKGYVDESVEDEDSFRGKVGNVDDESFLDDDESDDDEKDQKPLVRTPLKIKFGRAFKNDDDDESDSSGSHIAATTTPRLTLTHMPKCPSKIDAITMDKLPTKHVCFVSPDGRSKQCFALETLHKIALSGSPVLNEEGKPCFKQPPHFRSIASDDLLDQIASRFGRSALDLEGDFYKRKKASPPNLKSGDGTADSEEDSTGEEEDPYGYMVNFDGSLADDETFFERLSKYMTHCMGSRDIYCCPVCYTEAYRQLTDDNYFSKAEDESAEGFLNFKFDPMRILGSVDGDKYRVASACCFTKIVDVKNHLRKDHKLDPSVLDGNSLFARFQIRASDGLLQRFLDRTRHETYQGYMKKYWNEGNNELFVYLLHLMERTKRMRSNLEDNGMSDNVAGLEEARELMDAISQHWTSIEDRVPGLWDRLSAPYRKVTKEEMNEFLADDDESIEEEEVPHHLMNRTIQSKGMDPSPEEEIVAALRERQFQYGYSDDDDDDDEPEEEEEEEEAAHLEDSEGEEMEGYYSETDEEEEDEWVAALQNKRKARVRDNKRRRRNIKVVETESKKLGKKRGSKPTIAVSAPSTTSGIKSKRRRIIEESDSD